MWRKMTSCILRLRLEDGYLGAVAARPFNVAQDDILHYALRTALGAVAVRPFNVAQDAILRYALRTGLGAVAVAPSMWRAALGAVAARLCERAAV
jgi:hypothetical protein